VGGRLLEEGEGRGSERKKLRRKRKERNFLNAADQMANRTSLEFAEQSKLISCGKGGEENEREGGGEMWGQRRRE